MAHTEFDNFILLGGFDFAIQVIPSSEQVFFHTGLSTSIYTHGNSFDCFDTQINNSVLLKAPFTLEYRFPQRLIQPSFSIGYNIYLIGNKSSIDFSFIPTVSAGAILNINKRIALSIIPSIEFIPDILNFVPYLDFCLSTGIQIRL